MKITGIESNKEITEEIGSRIKRQRINMGLTQLELANKAGVSPRTITSIESGSDTKLSIIISVLRAMNILNNIDLLVEEEKIRPSDYLLLDKPRERAGNRKKAKKTIDWNWG